MLGTQITFIQDFGAFNFHIWHSNWGGGLKSSHWKVFKNATKVHTMSHVKVRSLTTYHIFCWQNLENFHWNYML